MIFLVDQFGNGDQSVRLVADVDAHFIIRNLHDRAGDRLARADGNESFSNSAANSESCAESCASTGASVWG